MTDERKDETKPQPEDTEPEAAAPADEAPAAATEETTASESAVATEPAPVPVPPRRLVRRADGKMLAGVCTGLAAYLGLDPVLVRVGFVLATVLGGGMGLVAYIVLWLVMPMAPEGEPLPPAPHTDWFDSSSVWRWTAIGLIIAAVFLLSNNLWHFRASLFWGLILLGIGVALWSRELHVRSNGDKPNPPTPTTRATVPLVAQSPEPITGGSAVTTPVRPTPPPPISSPQRRTPSALGRLVVGAAALAVGAMVLLDNLQTVHVTARMGMAVVLAVIGGGLVIGSFWGRARWLIFPGAALALIVGGVSLIPDAGPRTGNVEWAPASLADLRMNYRHGAGNVELNLSNVTFDSEPRTINVRIGFGNLEIVVPDDVPVFVHSRVQGGNLELFGHETNGWDIRESRREPGDDDKFGLLTINTRSGFGNTEVRRPRPGDGEPSNFRFNFDSDGFRSFSR